MKTLTCSAEDYLAVCLKRLIRDYDYENVHRVLYDLLPDDLKGTPMPDYAVRYGDPDTSMYHAQKHATARPGVFGYGSAAATVLKIYYNTSSVDGLTDQQAASWAVSAGSHYAFETLRRRCTQLRKAGYITRVSTSPEHRMRCMITPEGARYFEGI